MRFKNSEIIAFVVLSMLTILCKHAQGDNKSKSDHKAKNIILLIGDGMGLSQVSASFYFQESTNFTRFKTIGLINTSSSSHKITDSAAGATAFSCGERTYNGAIGVSEDTVEIPNIVEILSDKEFKTGVISTSEITHATPAAFYAHAESRGMQDFIGEQLLKSDIDFFAGGGTDYYIERKDGINYLDSFPNYGFLLDTSSIDKPSNLDSDKKYGWLLAPDGMPKMTEGRGDFLPKASEKGLNFLSTNKKGFFLMIEGS